MSYTKAILQLIQDCPGICGEEIDARLQLSGRNIAKMIWPYIQRGDVVVNESRQPGSRKIRKAYASTHAKYDASKNRTYKEWTDDDVRTLTELYPLHPNAFIAQRLDRTVLQIEGKAHKLQLRKPSEYLPPAKNRFGPSILWSIEEIETLRQLYSDSKIAALSPILGKTPSQILVKAHELGLKKSAAFWKACGDRLMPLGTKTRLKPEPIGTEKIWNGYVYIKTEEKGPWIMKHRHIWQKTYGKYDHMTHCLWFIDRNPLNCDLNNLELITKKELTNRTSVLQYPKDLRDVIVLHNKLKRRLREQH